MKGIVHFQWDTDNDKNLYCYCLKHRLRGRCFAWFFFACFKARNDGEKNFAFVVHQKLQMAIGWIFKNANPKLESSSCTCLYPKTLISSINVFILCSVEVVKIIMQIPFCTLRGMIFEEPSFQVSFGYKIYNHNLWYHCKDGCF